MTHNQILTIPCLPRAASLELGDGAELGACDRMVRVKMYYIGFRTPDPKLSLTLYNG